MFCRVRRACELCRPEADFKAATSAQITVYFKPERAESPESSQPSESGCRVAVLAKGAAEA
jgi:hypothetical protein